MPRQTASTRCACALSRWSLHSSPRVCVHATRRHICAGTAGSAPPHLRQDRARPRATSAPGLVGGGNSGGNSRGRACSPSLVAATLDMCCRILSFACTTVQCIHASVQRSTARHVLAVGRRSISIRQQPPWGIRYSRHGTARLRCTRVGAFFGELDILLEHSALSFSAVATEPTELFVLTKSTLLKRFSPGR